MVVVRRSVVSLAFSRAPSVVEEARARQRKQDKLPAYRPVDSQRAAKGSQREALAEGASERRHRVGDEKLEEGRHRIEQRTC